MDERDLYRALSAVPFDLCHTDAADDPLVAEPGTNNVYDRRFDRRVHWSRWFCTLLTVPNCSNGACRWVWKVNNGSSV